MRTFSRSWKVSMIFSIIALAMAIAIFSVKTDTAETKNPFLIIGVICAIVATVILIKDYYRNKPKYR